MFIKKTGCGKYLISVSIQELSALRCCGGWFKTVAFAVKAKHINQHTSAGDPTKVEDTLNSIWEKTQQFTHEVTEARNAG